MMNLAKLKVIFYFIMSAWNAYNTYLIHGKLK